MYNGRITEIGIITATTVGRRRSIVVAANKTAGLVAPGGSVAVNGTCLSVTGVGDDWFEADLSEETAARTTLDEWPAGHAVNLEVPLRVGDPLDGHLVQGHVDGVGKVTHVEVDELGGRRVWIRPPKRLMDDVVGKGSVAVDGVSLTVAERLADRFSVALIPVTQRETTLGSVADGQRVNLESDLFAKSAGELHAAARLVAARTLAALPWAGELRGRAGVDKCAAHLATGGGVLIYDPDREAEADIVFAGAGFRPESMAFLLTHACGHTTVPCDRARLDRLEIEALPGPGDRHGTAPHVPVDLAAGTGTGVSAFDRAATIRRLAHPDAVPSDFLRPGHVFPLGARPGGLAERRGHTEASLALCQVAGRPTVAVICEVMGPDGRMLNGSAVERFALRWSLPMISVDDLAGVA
ncbi:MAG TPA: riboflavin synthase [Acidimicrobiales bacterium]|jgi:3,4-dihydroxy 2-butanone 4-phosphate synthase/3,4-dihydroxy 2-butanone 4-phosphate synthase/GTP cyclohydrolase II|nr:riboflavin synthase [Acidimicrobiales bacterium]